jgi:phosphate transport system permease protein
MGGVLQGFWQALRSSSGTLSVALYVYVNEYADTGTAFAIGAILLLLALLIDLLAGLAGRKLQS